jgi:uncharacterized protein (DUF305 family)
MSTIRNLAILTAAIAMPAFATNAGASDMAFPDKCKSEMSSGGDMAMQGNQMSGMAEYQMETMDGMKAMNMNMMQGMMKKDPDLSFVCGMIAHHMGAISMAEVELKHGDNAEAKAKAQKIIEDQGKEIKELTAWVDKEVK